MIDLIGSWNLISCINYRDDEGTPTFGNPPKGQLQYTADGHMSGFLMDPDWVAKGDVQANSFTEFFSYAGRWQIDGNTVRHDIELSSVPQKVGTYFIRTLHVINQNKIELVTAPETSKSGAVYITKLIWERNQ